MVTYVHGSSNFIRITIVLLEALGFGLIPANGPFPCVRRCRMEEEGQMRRRLSLSLQLLAFLYRGGRVALCNGQEPRHLSPRANGAARLSSVLRLFLSPSGCSRKMLAHMAWLCTQVLQMDLQACYLIFWLCCYPGTVTMCCRGLVQQSLLPAKIPLMALTYYCLQSVYGVSVHAAADCYRTETWKIASRDFASFLQNPNSFPEIRCALCYEKLVRASLLV